MSNVHPLRILLWTMLALLASSPARAEDVDLFSGSVASASKPNLLIILDNTSNWGSSFSATLNPLGCGLNITSKYCGVKTALYNAINATSVGQINIGLMMFNETGGSALSGGSPTGSHDGAYVRSAVKLMNATNKAALLSIINGLDVNNDKGANVQSAYSFEEARRYLGGLGVLNGNNTQAKLDLTAENGSHNTYISPSSGGCQRNFILYISNGPPSSNDNAAGSLLQTLNGGTLPAVIPLTPSNAQSNWMDEYAQKLFVIDNVPGQSGTQNIVTFGVALYDPTYNPDTQNTNVSGRELVKSAANQGGGKYFNATDAATLQSQLSTIITEIQAVDTVFTAATLPLAVNIQGTYLNQVYMGMFVPDSTSQPRWLGNLKQYQFLYDANANQLSLVDSAGNQAVSASTGFLVPTAQSFWSTATTGTSSTGTVNFWTNLPRGTPSGAYPNLLVQDRPDGEVVEKGGAAQQIRTDFLVSQAARNIFTCPLTGCTANALLSSTLVNTSTITGLLYQLAFTLSGALTITSTELSNITNWIRGTNNNGDEAGPGTTSLGQTATIRPSVHGDVLHSRPALVDYCSSPPCATPNVIAFYGANDGLLHAVQAGQGSNAGHELWSFVAPDNFAKLKRLRDNSPLVLLSGALSSAKHKDYFFDGSTAVYHTPSRTIIYATARRGGNFIYAFDVTTPTAPTFLWKIDNTTSGFSHLAQTWSAPQVRNVKGNTNPVLFFGAGYCGGYDILNNGVGEDSTTAATASPSCPVGQPDGRGVYVVDAFTGALIKFFQTATNTGSISDSVAADVTPIDRDFDGYVDRVYAADTGGTVWRMDVDNASVSNWKLFKFAVVKGGTYREKFLFAPDVVTTTLFDAVLIGSGNREDPLRTTSNNRFYMFKDIKTGKDATGMSVISNYAGMIDASTYTDTAALKTAVLDPTKNGWYYPMTTNGEEVVNAPLTIAGTVYFSTNRPTPNAADTGACSNLGEARAYTLNYLDGAPTGVNNTPNQILLGGGLPPSPTAGIVQIDSNTRVPFCIACGQVASPAGSPPAPPCGTSAINPCKIPVTPPAYRRKTFWSIKTDQ